MLVDRLVSNELVERRQPAQVADQRQIHVVLTQRGTEMLEQLAEAHREQLCRLEPNLVALCASLRGQSGEGL
jgi:DNA-binding MarR family transcriptional regulator